MPSGSAFPSPPFLLPQLLCNQLSLPPPPASLDTHAPSKTDLPPTHTPPTLFFFPSSSVGKVQRPCYFPPSFSVSLRLSADLSLLKRKMRRMHWCGCKDNLALLLWESWKGNILGFKKPRAKQPHWLWDVSTAYIDNCKTKFTLSKVHFKVTRVTLVWPWQLA